MLKGRVIKTNYNDLYLNLAIEHMLLNIQGISDYALSVRFWKNPKSIIIGRGQYIEQEVNIDYCRENNIQIARRLSGGGTVYQDAGNLNISFFVNQKLFPNLKNTFKIRSIFTKIFKETLFKLNFKCTSKDFNLYFNQKKISGSAGHLTSNSFVHHATLLYDANLEYLEGSILATKYDKSSKRRSRYEITTNLDDFDPIIFQNCLLETLSDYFKIPFEEYHLSSKEISSAESLQNSIYLEKSWIYKGKRLINDLDT